MEAVGVEEVGVEAVWVEAVGVEAVGVVGAEVLQEVLQEVLPQPTIATITAEQARLTTWDQRPRRCRLSVRLRHSPSVLWSSPQFIFYRLAAACMRVAGATSRIKSRSRDVAGGIPAGGKTGPRCIYSDNKQSRSFASSNFVFSAMYAHDRSRL